MQEMNLFLNFINKQRFFFHWNRQVSVQGYNQNKFLFKNLKGELPNWSRSKISSDQYRIQLEISPFIFREHSL